MELQQFSLLEKVCSSQALRVEEVRKVGDLYRQDLKERIDRKLETAGEKRDRKLNSIQERLRQHVSIPLHCHVVELCLLFRMWIPLPSCDLCN